MKEKHSISSWASKTLLGAGLMLILLGCAAWTRSRATELVANNGDSIEYVGIVPYRVHPRRKRAVACQGESSVACIFGNLASSVHKGLEGGGKPTAGQLAVKKAAEGKGFTWIASNRYERVIM
jgi:hypothetical protein